MPHDDEASDDLGETENAADSDTESKPFGSCCPSTPSASMTW